MDISYIDNQFEEILQMCRHSHKAIGSCRTEKHDFTKRYSKYPVTGPKEMEIQELLDKKFKIIFVRMLRELKENTAKQYNNIGKTIQEQNIN